MRITESLKIEHQLIRQMMETMTRWITEDVEPDKLRERAVMLEGAINRHSEREERQLFAPLNAYSGIAHDLVVIVERAHLEVCKLFETLADPTRGPKDLLLRIISYTSTHFTEEETGLFLWWRSPATSAVEEIIEHSTIRGRNWNHERLE